MSFSTYLSKKKPDDAHYMALAIKAAEQSKSNGDAPIGAVIVWPAGHMVESDTTFTERDATNHAVMNVIRKVVQTCRSNLNDAVLYCSVEPCPMCAFAAAQCGVKEVIFGAYDLKHGVVSTKVNEHVKDVVFKGGILAEQSVSLFSKKFQEHIVAEVTSG